MSKGDSVITEDERNWLKNELITLNHRAKSERNNIDLYLKKACAEWVLGLTDQAAESAKLALCLNENLFMGWYQLGLAYSDAKKFLEAREAFKKAMACWETHPNKKGDAKFIINAMRELRITEMLGNSMKQTEKKGA